MAKSVLDFWKNPPAQWLEAIGGDKHEVLNRHSKTIVDEVCKVLDEGRGIAVSDWALISVGVDGQVHVPPAWGSSASARNTAQIQASLNAILKQLLSPEDFDDHRSPQAWKNFFAHKPRRRDVVIPPIKDAGFEQEAAADPQTAVPPKTTPPAPEPRSRPQPPPLVVKPVPPPLMVKPAPPPQSPGVAIDPPRSKTGTPPPLTQPRPKPRVPAWVKSDAFMAVVAIGITYWWFGVEMPRRAVEKVSGEAAETVQAAKEKADAEAKQKQMAAIAEAERVAREKAEAEEQQKQMAAKAEEARKAKEKADADEKAKAMVGEAERKRLAEEQQKQMTAKAEEARKAKEKADADEKAKAMAAEAERKRLAALEEERKRKEAAPVLNSLGMKFVPAGTPGVLFSVWETRVQDFTAFVADTGYDAINDSSFGKPAYTVEKSAGGSSTEWLQRGGTWQDPHFPTKQTADHPVVCVSYLDAEAFCAWLTKKDRAAGKIPATASYRLPTDAEWSSACGSSKYPWGQGYPPRSTAGNYSGKEAMVGALEGISNPLVESGFSDSSPRTAPVGKFEGNPYGLSDMGGNVFEWCSTWYEAGLNDPDLLAEFPGLKNDGGGQAYRVLRGASWSSKTETGLRTSCRHRGDPHLRNDFFGFRCVLVMPPAAPTPPSAAPPAQPAPPLPAPKPAGGDASPKVATQVTAFENSLRMKFVPVPISSGPSRGRTVLFSIWDTRVKDYRVYAQAQRIEMTAPSFAQTEDHAVVNVSWMETMAFCQWLSKKEGKTYRLPTDLEWSCAAGLDPENGATPRERAESAAGTYPWGSAWPPPAGAGNYDVSLHVDDYPCTSPVGKFPANAHGLYDMGGNVWQWCEDWDDPALKTDHVLRGGSWGDSAPSNLLSSSRGVRPTHRDEYIGFRVVLEVTR